MATEKTPLLGVAGQAMQIGGSSSRLVKILGTSKKKQPGY